MNRTHKFSRQPEQVTRRQFLDRSNKFVLGSATAASAILNLNLLSQLAGADLPEAEDDYRALVCVHFAGGNDSFNMVAPCEGSGYEEYLESRGGIALPSSGEVDGLLPLDGVLVNGDGRKLGIHPSLPFLQAQYNSGKAAIVANVGTLVEPTTLANLQSGNFRVPLGLFSHSDQSMQWQTSLSDQRSAATGWGGRMADLLAGFNEPSNVSMNVSGAGDNIFQTGINTIAYAFSANGSVELSAWNSPSNAARRQAVEGILNAEYQNAFERAFAVRKKGAIQSNADYREAILVAPTVNSPFTRSNSLSAQLKIVAKTIAARKVLCKQRQTFFVQLDGFDLHGNLGTQHAILLGRVNQALSEFQVALVEMGVMDKVTTFTSSDFGRTLSSNGSGTDHAWGGNHLVFGGAVNGGQVYGTYPELALESSLDTGRGRLIPTTSVDEYVSDLALWMGVSKTNLPLVLPNLSRFHDPDLGPAMGYMATT
ncbi:MAG: DUF1501 domain-containing protein [Akkermansiaceae bacterium]